MADYAVVAERITAAAESLVERAGVEPGMAVLDVACGTGNAAIPAARLGARVTGLDLVPELLDVARERAADAMLEIEWVQGDAQALPFADAGFDRVLSVFGHMFAPDHERAAAELRRVCRPGGAIGICCWTPAGAPGDMFASPTAWGAESHVRELLGDDVDFERGTIEWVDESVAAYARFLEQSFGRERADLATLERWNAAGDGSFRIDAEYLLAVVRP